MFRFPHVTVAVVAAVVIIAAAAVAATACSAALIGCRHSDLAIPRASAEMSVQSIDITRM